MKAINNKEIKHFLLRYSVWAILLLGALTMILPFVWMISTSLKHANLVYTIPPPTWIPNPVDWENYRAVWEVSNLATGIFKQCNCFSISRLFCNYNILDGSLCFLQVVHPIQTGDFYHIAYYYDDSCGSVARTSIHPVFQDEVD